MFSILSSVSILALFGRTVLATPSVSIPLFGTPGKSPHEFGATGGFGLASGSSQSNVNTQLKYLPLVVDTGSPYTFVFASDASTSCEGVLGYYDPPATFGKGMFQVIFDHATLTGDLAIETVVLADAEKHEVLRLENQLFGVVRRCSTQANLGIAGLLGLASPDFAEVRIEGSKGYPDGVPSILQTLVNLNPPYQKKFSLYFDVQKDQGALLLGDAAEDKMEPSISTVTTPFVSSAYLVEIQFQVQDGGLALFGTDLFAIYDTGAPFTSGPSAEVLDLYKLVDQEAAPCPGSDSSDILYCVPCPGGPTALPSIGIRFKTQSESFSDPLWFDQTLVWTDNEDGQCFGSIVGKTSSSRSEIDWTIGMDYIFPLTSIFDWDDKAPKLTLGWNVGTGSN